jgi:ectoine utilization protein EutC
MSDLLVLTRAELTGLVGFGDEERAAIEAVYPVVSRRVGSMPPVMRVDVPEHHGEIDVKTAYLPGFEGIAIKVSAGFFDNPARGLPSLGGLMVVLDATTGVPTAALFDGGWLTDLRTALGGAVAAEYLAPLGARSAAVLGAGVQARLQLRALVQVRRIERATIWARRADAAMDLASAAAEELGIEVVTAATPSAAAAAADVVVTTTPATEPLLDADALHERLHVTAVGSDAEHKQELGASLLREADLVVCDHLDQSRRLGELRRADRCLEAIELGEIVAGHVPGRSSEDAITVCDLTGTGAQDTAIADLVVRRARAAGVGTHLDVGDVRPDGPR